MQLFHLQQYLHYLQCHVEAVYGSVSISHTETSGRKQSTHVAQSIPWH